MLERALTLILGLALHVALIGLCLFAQVIVIDELLARPAFARRADALAIRLGSGPLRCTLPAVAEIRLTGPPAVTQARAHQFPVASSVSTH